MPLESKDDDRLFVREGFRHYRRRYSLTEVRWGWAVLASLLAIAGWVAWKGAHPDPALFSDGASLLNPAGAPGAVVPVATAPPVAGRAPHRAHHAGQPGPGGHRRRRAPPGQRNPGSAAQQPGRQRLERRQDRLVRRGQPVRQDQRARRLLPGLRLSAAVQRAAGPARRRRHHDRRRDVRSGPRAQRAGGVRRRTTATRQGAVDARRAAPLRSQRALHGARAVLHPRARLR